MVFEMNHLLRIVAALDLESLDGLYWATMFGVGFMLGTRPGELHLADIEDFGFRDFQLGVDWTLAFSKSDQNGDGVCRGMKHRRGCPCRGDVVNDSAATFCVPCALHKYLRMRGKTAGIMWPGFGGEGAITKNYPSGMLGKNKRRTSSQELLRQETLLYENSCGESLPFGYAWKEQCYVRYLKE